MLRGLYEADWPRSSRLTNTRTAKHARGTHARTHPHTHTCTRASTHARKVTHARSHAARTHTPARPPARPLSHMHAHARTHARTGARLREPFPARAEKSQGKSATAREHVIARARALDRVQMRSQMADANSQTHARARFRGPTHASRHPSHPYELPLIVDRRGRRRYAQTSAPALSPLTP